MNILDHARSKTTYQFFIINLNNYCCTQHNYIRVSCCLLQEGTNHLDQLVVKEKGSQEGI
jgi:hypothetical protein